MTQKTKPIRDKKYLRWIAGHNCINCDAYDVGTIVAAHIRWGHEGGTSLKPGDDLTVPLCFDCHADQEAHPGPEWWANALKNRLREQYLHWKLANP